MTDPSPNELTAEELGRISAALSSVADRWPDNLSDVPACKELRRLSIKTASLAFNQISS